MRITVDRIENGYAVCITDRGEDIDIPSEVLPEAAEGKQYDMSFTELKAEEKDMAERIAQKAKKLWAD